MRRVRQLKFSEIAFTWNDSERQLAIAPRKGNFKGMIGNRQFRIVLVGSESGCGDQPMKETKTIDYDGQGLTVQL